jgi:hypothetical protein
MMVSPAGPKPSVCFMLPYLLAIPAASINKVGFDMLRIEYVYFYGFRILEQK